MSDCSPPAGGSWAVSLSCAILCSRVSLLEGELDLQKVSVVNFFFFQAIFWGQTGRVSQRGELLMLALHFNVGVFC